MKPLTLSLAIFMLSISPLVMDSEARTTPPDYKKTVGFVFGNVHMTGVDKSQYVVEAALGTAFFIAYPDERGGPKYNFYYIVTAKHVLRDTDNSFLRSVRIRLNLLASDNGSDFDYVTVPVTDEKGNLLWLHDEVDSLDEAVAFPLLPDTRRFDFKAIPVSLFADKGTLGRGEVSEGDTLFFIGLQPQFYGAKKNFPVIRKGSLALLTDEPIPIPGGLQRGYIGEVASWPGNSGSPVFLSLSGPKENAQSTRGNPWLLGILIGSFNNIRLGEALGSSSTVSFGDTSNVGLAFILPAAQIRTVLDSGTAKVKRDAEISALHRSAP